MSYDIDTFKVKKLENLQLIVNDLTTSPYCERVDNDDRTTTFIFNGNEACEIIGHIIGNHINVISIDWSGEYSGRTMEDILEPALRRSTGQFIASCVWEAGESINRIIVDNGKIEWENIDI